MSGPSETFLALNPETNTLAASRISVLPVPYAETVSYRPGTDKGPAAIIHASIEMEDYDPELGRDPCTVGIHTLPPFVAIGHGPEGMAASVADEVERLTSSGALVCMLGGEHSLTAGAVEGVARSIDSLSVLIFDAQADLRDEYQGWRYSHACAARRILDHAPITLVGIRSMTAYEADFIDEHSIPCFTRGPQSITDVDAIVATLLPNVYVSVDLDVFDPSIMAAVGTPEPGGMFWWEVLSLLRAVAERRRIVGFDIMELAPAEGPEACAYTAAKLAYKLMAYATMRP